jgi:hypothetical protein
VGGAATLLFDWMVGWFIVLIGAVAAIAIVRKEMEVSWIEQQYLRGQEEIWNLKVQHFDYLLCNSLEKAVNTKKGFCRLCGAKEAGLIEDALDFRFHKQDCLVGILYAESRIAGEAGKEIVVNPAEILLWEIEQRVRGSINNEHIFEN